MSDYTDSSYFEGSDEHKLGDTGEHIEKLQRDLLKLGANPGALDGVYGEKTEEAVKTIQRNWLCTGRVNKQLAERIKRNADQIVTVNPRSPGVTQPVSQQSSKKAVAINRNTIKLDFTQHNYSSRRGESVSHLVYHYTAVYGTYEDKVPRSNGIFKSPASQVSAHYVIAYDGTVWHVVPEEWKAWHAGPSYHSGRYDINPVSIGIEIENWGPLKDLGGGRFSYASNTNLLYTGKLRQELGEPVKVSQDNYNFWMPYSQKQIEAVKQLSKDIITRYNIRKDNIIGHRDISGPPVSRVYPKAYTGKMDPGPAFPMEEIKESLY